MSARTQPGRAQFPVIGATGRRISFGDAMHCIAGGGAASCTGGANVVTADSDRRLGEYTQDGTRLRDYVPTIGDITSLWTEHSVVRTEADELMHEVVADVEWLRRRAEAKRGSDIIGDEEADRYERIANRLEDHVLVESLSRDVIDTLSAESGLRRRFPTRIVAENLDDEASDG